jgi:hypothetical protein
MRDCDVSSSSGAGVGVDGGDLQLLRSKVHDCQAHGLALFGDLTGKNLAAGAHVLGFPMQCLIPVSLPARARS